MIKDGVVADTSALIAFFKGAEPVAGAVERLIIEKRLCTTGIIIAELLQGVKTAKEEDHIADCLSALPSVELTTELWVKAGRLSWSLRRTGVCLPLTDVAIAAAAIEHNLSLLTLDNHFKKIPNLKHYHHSGRP